MEQFNFISFLSASIFPTFKFDRNTLQIHEILMEWIEFSAYENLNNYIDNVAIKFGK